MKRQKDWLMGSQDGDCREARETTTSDRKSSLSRDSNTTGELPLSLLELNGNDKC